MNASTIGRVPLFAALPPAELATLAASLRQSRYPAHTVLFREGDYGDRFYIVLDGQIAIIKALDTDDERLLTVHGAGAFIGEMSLLSPDGLRTASARVHADAQMLELTRADFDALLQRHPMLAYEMLRVLSTRLREAQDAAIRDLHEKNERLAQALADLHAAQAQIIEQETLERELRRAREIQESILPRTLPRLAGFDIGARMLPARMVGGDFFDVIPLAPDNLGVVIGDVSGKGIPAALFMALTCSLLRAEARRVTSPEEVLRSVNAHLLGMNARGMFVTVLYGVLDRTTQEFVYVRAGHELPLVWDATGTALPPTTGRGLPLGLFPYPVLDIQTVRLPAGSTLLLYTDGVTEATDAKGELFGLERLIATTRISMRAAAQELCDDVLQAVTTYHGPVPQADDITVLAVQAH